MSAPKTYFITIKTVLLCCNIIISNIEMVFKAKLVAVALLFLMYCTGLARFWLYFATPNCSETFVYESCTLVKFCNILSRGVCAQATGIAVLDARL